MIEEKTYMGFNYEKYPEVEERAVELIAMFTREDKI